MLREQVLGLLGPGVHTVALEGSADLLALGWSDPPRARPELRFQTSDGSFSRWVCAAPAGHEDSAGSVPRIVGEPLWTGGTRLVQLRSAHAVRGARLYAVDVSDGAGAARLAARAPAAESAAAEPLAAPVLAAGPGQPPIIARRAWAGGVSHPRVAPEYGAVEMAFVHHTENPNGYSAAEVPAMLYAIYLYHRYVRGWKDIGYNFMIDAFGRIWEARAGGVDQAVGYVGAIADPGGALRVGIVPGGQLAGHPADLLRRAGRLG